MEALKLSPEEIKLQRAEEYDSALTILEAVAGGYLYPDYKHTVDVDNLCYQVCTGDGIEAHVKQFMPREDKSTWEHRKKAIKSIVPVVYNMLTDPQYQVPRSNNSVRVLTYESGNEKTQGELEAILQAFDGKKGVDEWMATRWIDLNNEGPNSWVVLEWKEFDNTKGRIQPYPFEVYADQIVDFAGKNNETEHICVKTSRTVNERSLNVFTYYGKFQSVVITKADKDEKAPDGSTTVQVKDDPWFVYAPYIHNLSFVPAFRPGYNPDKTTRAKTYVSPINRAMPVLMKLLDADSEFEFTRACHIFPKEYRYDRECDNKGCNGGRLATGGQCPICKGTGFLMVTDHDNTGTVVKIALPKNATAEQIIDLSKMVYYATPPIELLKIMKDHLKDLKEECQTALYGSQVFTKQQVSQTATAARLDMQAMYNALYQMALSWANDWEWLVKSIAAITDLSTGLVCSYRFGKDLKLKSLDTLYADLEIANKSGAAPFIRQAIQDDVARIIYAEDSREMLKQSVMNWFDPFAGKADTERAWLAASSLVSKKSLMLYANFMPIFKELEYEQGSKGLDFFKLTREKQIELVDAKIQALIDEQPAPATNLFQLPLDMGALNKNNLSDNPLAPAVKTPPVPAAPAKPAPVIPPVKA